MANPEFIDHSKEVMSEVEKAFKRAGEIIGGTMERYAKENLTANGSVDTGLLRNSITHGMAGEQPKTTHYTSIDGKKEGDYDGVIPKPLYSKDEHLVVVGTNVTYAPFVELGTSRQRAKPYLRPAVEQHIDEYRQILQNEFSSLT